MRYVQRYSSSIKNLERVLDRKIDRAKVEPGELPAIHEARDAVIGRLLDAGLLDDGVYSKWLALSLHQQGRTQSAIARRLLEKGVPQAEIEAALETLGKQSEDPDRVAAWNLARRRGLGPFRSDPTTRVDRRQRDLGVLARAGFHYDLASEIVDSEPDDELL